MKNVIEYSKSRRVYLYDDWPEFVAGAVAGADVKAHSHSNRARESWDYGVGWLGAVSLAERGWPEGLAKVREIAASIDDSVVGQVKRSVLVYDVAGEAYDLGRLADGDPECALTFRRQMVTGRTARLVVSGSAACSVSSDEFYRRGSAVIALIDAFEYAGVRCEVVYGAQTTQSGNHTGYGVVLKRPEDSLNMDIMAFALSHPACMRRLGFGLWESEDNAWRDKGGFGRHGHGGYGAPEAYRLPEDEGIEVGVPSFQGGAWRSDEAMLKWVQEQVGALVNFEGGAK